jgi:putative ABC transport system permease protein
VRPSLRLAAREIARSGPQSALFVLSTTLALVTLVALGGFSRAVQRSVARDARELHAGDVILHSHREFSPALEAEVEAVEREGLARAARLHDFYSMARSADGSRSLLASVLAAPPAYPFYGTVLLASGRPFAGVHAPGGVVAEQALLDRLGLRVGDAVLLGRRSLAVRDVLVREPDRPVNAFSFGPRVIVHADDLASLGLVQTGSRVERRTLLKAAREGLVDPLAARLGAKALAGEERVETFRTARTAVKRFFDNFLFFLSLIGIFTLVLAGFGIQSSLTALLREKRDTLAVMRALGATSAFVARQAALMVFLLALGGTVLGILLGGAAQRLLPLLFRGIVPDDAVSGGLSAGAVLEGCLLGAVVAALFTSVPLRRLREIRPAAVVGREVLPETSRAPLLVRGGLVALFAAALIVWKIRDLRIGLWFVAGVGGLILAAALASWLLLRAGRAAAPRRLVPRLVARGLERPGSGTLVTLTTLVTSLAAILALHLVELNLDRTFVRSFPEDAPNVFFLDIQTAQREGFARELGVPAEFHPVVRARVAAINGEPIDQERERAARRDNLAREFNLTWRDTLLEDEVVYAGPGLFDPSWSGPQVSVLDEVLEMRDLRLGDSITFTVGGVPIEARVTSLRRRNRSSVRPFFYFVLPPALLRDAPQTIFAAARVPRAEVPAVQTRVVAGFPNVSVIDVTETARVLSGVMRRLSGIVRFFTWLSIAAGLLIVTSAVLATRHARLRESVYYRVLGARRGFVLRVFAAEHLALGAAAAGVALAFAELAGWLVCRFSFDIDFHPFLSAILPLAGGTALLVLATGLAGSLPALRVRPVVYLRAVTQE